MLISVVAVPLVAALDKQQAATSAATRETVVTVVAVVMVAAGHTRQFESSVEGFCIFTRCRPHKIVLKKKHKSGFRPRDSHRLSVREKRVYVTPLAEPNWFFFKPSLVLSVHEGHADDRGQRSEKEGGGRTQGLLPSCNRRDKTDLNQREIDE